MTSSDDKDALREEARKHVEELPAETALGNRDPQGGGQGDPKDYEGLGAGADRDTPANNG